MSSRSIESLHPATWASIQLQGVTAFGENPVRTWACGCSQQKNGKIWLCQYHDILDDVAWELDGDDST